MKDSLKDHLVKADAQHTFQGYPLISDQVTKEGVGLVWRELETLAASWSARQHRGIWLLHRHYQLVYPTTFGQIQPIKTTRVPRVRLI